MQVLGIFELSFIIVVAVNFISVFQQFFTLYL